MEYDWEPEKAVINIVKHGVTFHEATTVFDDRNCVTGYDPIHSGEEERFITVGISNLGRLLIVWYADRGVHFASSVQELLLNASEMTIQMADPDPGDMLPEYDFSKMKGLVRGKFASRITSEPRTVRLADDLAVLFPNDEAVNAALRDYLSGHTIGPKGG